MKKQRIVLASVLKPIDDTRMFEKLGVSISGFTKSEVYIIGFPSSVPPRHTEITFIPLTSFKRLSLKRLLVPFQILKKTYQVKPDILVVNTHELLRVAMLIRILFGTRIIYDLQENYWRNILWTNTYPTMLRWPLAALVRLKEKMLARYIDHFFLAEKCFETEMKFFGNRYTILENKAMLPSTFARLKPTRKLNLLFSGTISESTGIFEAIYLAECLHKADPAVHLQIIGYCAHKSTLKKLYALIEDKPFVSLTGGQNLVPHSEILSQIAQADFGIIYYTPSPHTANKVPTKLYEYLAARLPILLQNNPYWVAICSPYHASVPIDFKSIDATELLQKMKLENFYTTAAKDVEWQIEVGKLTSVINKFLP